MSSSSPSSLPSSQKSNAARSGGEAAANLTTMDRLERQAERERQRKDAMELMDQCANRSSVLIFEAVGGDIDEAAVAAVSAGKGGDTVTSEGRQSVNHTSAGGKKKLNDKFARKFLWETHEDGVSDASPSPGRSMFGPSLRASKQQPEQQSGASAGASNEQSRIDSTPVLRNFNEEPHQPSLLNKTSDALYQGVSWVQNSILYIRDGVGKRKKDDGNSDDAVDMNINIAPRRQAGVDHPPSATVNIHDAGTHGNLSSLFSRIQSIIITKGSLAVAFVWDRRRTVLIAIAVTAFVVGIVFSAVSGRTASIAKGGKKGFRSPGVSFDPKERLNAMKEILVGAGISPERAFDDSESLQYQYMALRWLSEEDASRIPVDDAYMPQRYALACLWYSSVVALDVPNANAKRSEDNKGNRGLVTKSGWASADKWLSDKGICAWQGITCHRNPDGLLPQTSEYDKNNGITAISLRRNGLKGQLPREIFTALPDIVSLDLRENDISSTVPPEVGSAKKLEILKLSSNQLDGELPPSIGDLSELRLLNLFHNSFNSSIPESIERLINLRELYLDSNYLTGTIPGSINALSNLVDLRLRRNFLTGHLPSFEGLDNIEILYLDANALTGQWTVDSLGSASKLREITLYKNRITGTLPSSLSKLSKLEKLYIDHNSFESSIPPSWGQLKQLRHFFAYENALSGNIDVVAEMESLEKLHLEVNKLTSTIPSQLGELENLQVLDLSNNEFIGTVPASLGKLTKLDRLVAYNNFFDGIIPEEVCSLTTDYVLRDLVLTCEGRNTVSGVRCSCCTECKSDLGS